jgi:ribosome biogenesis ATPase
VRTLFERARQSAPCVVFFDEIDALCPRRDGEANAESSARVVNQMLTEMDGVDGGRGAGVYVLAATNRPDMVDPAMTRPGRLDRCLYVPLPDASERVDILRTLGRATPWDEDVDLAAVALDPRCDGFSGADLSCLVREAALAAIRSALPGYGMVDDAMPSTVPLTVSLIHIEEAFSRVSPSVSPLELRRYAQIHASLYRH